MFGLSFILLEAVRPGTPSRRSGVKSPVRGDRLRLCSTENSTPGISCKRHKATVSLQQGKVLSKTCIAPLWKTTVHFLEGPVVSIDGQAHSHVRTG